MKKIIPFFLYPSYFKYIGLGISAIGIILFLFLNTDYQLLFYFGLITSIFSKERNESELVANVRSESFRIVFAYIFSLFLAVFVTDHFFDRVSFPASPFLLVGLPLLFYMFYFNLLLLINLDKEEKSSSSRSESIQWLVLMLVFAMIFVIKYLQ